MKLKTLISIAVILCFTKISNGQSAEELAKKLSNPVASMISFPLQNNLDVRIGKYNGFKLTLNIQPVIPVSLSRGLNLINRIILPVVSQYDIDSKGSFQSGLSDAVISNFFSPAKSEIIWGIGPVFLVPTATDELLGTEKFGMGPTGVILKQTKSTTIGALVNQIWSVAGKENRNDVSQLYVNPFFSLNYKSGATITFNFEYSRNWENETAFGTITPTFSAVTKIGNQPLSVGFAPRMIIYSNSRPAYGMRGILTLVFPK